jgi:hypothetical protein
MVSVFALWIPILLSAALVFVVSSLIHMVLGYHQNDFRRHGKEDEIMSALRRFNLPPGDYALPHAGTFEAMRQPAFLEKMKKGPVVLMTVSPNGPPALGSRLALWFLYSVVVGVFAAYLAGRALGPGAPYLAVFRFVGTSALLGYSLALMQDSIWWNRSWAMTARSMFDGLVYALLTAGVFGWLWP